MNESEARRVALTAAVAWCSDPNGMDLSTDAMLAYAEQFETWLLRPAVDAPEPGTWCPACNIVVAWCIHTTAVNSVPVSVPEPRPVRCTCTFRSTHDACASCGHDAHDPGACACTTEYTKPTPVVTIPEQREAPRTRPNPSCTHCEHGPHAGPTCVYCACTGRASEVRCLNCGHDVPAHTSHGCTHGREHMDSGWEHACICPYTAVNFRDREGDAPTVVTIPEQRGAESTVPHDPYMDGPMPVDAVECTCLHVVHTPDETGRCTFLGCTCALRGQA